jgi:hypothetical protein
MSTNVAIAELLQKQTYGERMKMAESLADVLDDARRSMSIEDGFDADHVASILQGWADAEVEEPTE